MALRPPVPLPYRDHRDGGGGGGGSGLAEVASANLSAVGTKIDLDAALDAATMLEAALTSLQDDRPSRLPSNLSSTQRLELRSFVEEALANTPHADASGEVWQAIEPDAEAAVVTYAPRAAVKTLLTTLRESREAILYLDRLRG